MTREVIVTNYRRTFTVQSLSRFEELVVVVNWRSVYEMDDVESCFNVFEIILYGLVNNVYPLLRKKRRQK